MITLTDYLMGRDVEDPLSEEQELNADIIVDRLAQLESAFGEALFLTSGYRPPQITHMTCGALHGDAHEQCAGADLRDRDHALSSWCLQNLDVLEAIGLWMEDPASAKNHLHVQIYPPRSGNRVFVA